MKIAQNRGYVQDVLYSGFTGRLYGCSRLITSGTSNLAKNRLCQMGKTATSGGADDCMDAGGSECLEHILERGFQSSPESNFLSLIHAPRHGDSRQSCANKTSG